MKKIGLVALFALLLAGCDDGGEKKAQEICVRPKRL